MSRHSKRFWGWLGNVEWHRPGILLNTSRWDNSLNMISTSSAELIVLCTLDWGVTPKTLSIFVKIVCPFDCEWQYLSALVSCRFFWTSCPTLWSIGMHPPAFPVSLKYLPHFNFAYFSNNHLCDYTRTIIYQYSPHFWRILLLISDFK